MPWASREIAYRFIAKVSRCLGCRTPFSASCQFWQRRRAHGVVPRATWMAICCQGGRKPSMQFKWRSLPFFVKDSHLARSLPGMSHHHGLSSRESPGLFRRYSQTVHQAESVTSPVQPGSSASCSADSPCRRSSIPARCRCCPARRKLEIFGPAHKAGGSSSAYTQRTCS